VDVVFVPLPEQGTGPPMVGVMVMAVVLAVAMVEVVGVTVVEVVVSERILALGMGQPMVLLIPCIPPRR